MKIDMSISEYLRQKLNKEEKRKNCEHEYVFVESNYSNEVEYYECAKCGKKIKKVFHKCIYCGERILCKIEVGNED